jgi:hypothetical protein
MLLGRVRLHMFRLVMSILVSVGLGVICDASAVPLGKAGVVNAQGSSPDSVLLAEGERRQVIQFNPNAALQQRIFADRFVPNSSEFRLTMARVDYAAQRAENLSTGAVRVYYVQVGDWANISYTEGGTVLGDALVAEGQRKQVIQFNPNAALQKRMFAENFVPNSAEYSVSVGGSAYTAQRAENLTDGQVRVYHVVAGDWNNVRISTRGNSGTVSTFQPPQPQAPPVVQPQPSAGGNCDPSYPDVCIKPYPPDLDCDDIPYTNFRVVGRDPHRFDGDRDGVGCERR